MIYTQESIAVSRAPCSNLLSRVGGVWAQQVLKSHDFGNIPSQHNQEIVRKSPDTREGLGPRHLAINSVGGNSAKRLTAVIQTTERRSNLVLKHHAIHFKASKLTNVAGYAPGPPL